MSLKLATVKLIWQHLRRSTCRGEKAEESFEPGSRRTYPYFCIKIIEFSYNTREGYVPNTSSIVQPFRYNALLWRTDGHPAVAHITLAGSRAVKIKTDPPMTSKMKRLIAFSVNMWARYSVLRAYLRLMEPEQLSYDISKSFAKRFSCVPCTSPNCNPASAPGG